MKKITHASLCTGIGACELAATWMGWENLFSCEINEFCNKVLKYHYPNAIHYGNIFEQDFNEWRGRVDVLTAGFPCQPFSCAGKRNGAEDDRYLWPEVLRVINEVRPTWFIGENVGGIITMVLPGEEIKVGSYTDVCGENYTFYEKRQRYVIEQIRLDLESIGYSVQPVVIPACAVGAPHRRDRVWFIASNRTDTGVESLQREGEDCIHAIGDVTDTDGAGLPETGTKQRTTGVAGDGLQGSTPHSKSDGSHRTPRTAGKKTERSDWKKIKQSIVRCEIRTSSNPSKQGFQERLNNGKQEVAEEARTRANDGLERLGGKRVASNCNSKRLQRSCFDGEHRKKRTESQYKQISRCLCPTWENFPTQSPVCYRDDGASFGLSGISFSRWRQESIKALGNSMVPQVVYEIFRAIEQCNNYYHEQEL